MTIRQGLDPTTTHNPNLPPFKPVLVGTLDGRTPKGRKAFAEIAAGMQSARDEIAKNQRKSRQAMAALANRRFTR